MKRAYLAASAAAISLTTLAAPVQAADYNWRLTHFANKTSDFFVVMTQPFLDRMQEFLGDEVKITAFGGGELAPGFKAYEAVQDGIADMAHTTPLYAVNANFANSFVGTHPGGMSADAMVYWFYEAGGQDLLTEFKRETMGLHTLIAGCNTSEIWLSHKPLQTLDDLKGVKFRTAGAWATLLKEDFGAAPVVVPGTEVYTMFERGGVDAIEWSGISEDLQMGFDAIAEYATVPAPHSRGGCFELAWPVDTWDNLPEDLRTKIEAIAKLATFDTLLIWKRQEIEALAKLKDADLIVVEPSPEMTEAVYQAAKDYTYKLAEEQADTNPWLKRLADSYYGAMAAYNSAAPVLTPVTP